MSEEVRKRPQNGFWWRFGGSGGPANPFSTANGRKFTQMGDQTGILGALEYLNWTLARNFVALCLCARRIGGRRSGIFSHKDTETRRMGIPDRGPELCAVVAWCEVDRGPENRNHLTQRHGVTEGEWGFGPELRVFAALCEVALRSARRGRAAGLCGWRKSSPCRRKRGWRFRRLRSP